MTTTMPADGSAPATTSRSTAAEAATAAPATTPVWKVGVVAGMAASVATTAVAIGAKAIDIPMKAAPQNADAGRAIPLTGYAMGTLMCTAIGTLLAVFLARRAKRPAPTFVIVTTLLTVASFAGPITTGHATTATRLVLSLTHVVAAVIVIPALARRLAQPAATTTGDRAIRPA